MLRFLKSSFWSKGFDIKTWESCILGSWGIDLFSPLFLLLLFYVYMYACIWIYVHWLWQKLASPSICCVQAGDLGELIESLIESLWGIRAKELKKQLPVRGSAGLRDSSAKGRGKINVSTQAAEQGVSSTFWVFCSIWDSAWMNPYIEKKPSALFSLPVQMLISSRNILTDTPRNNV